MKRKRKERKQEKKPLQKIRGHLLEQNGNDDTLPEIKEEAMCLTF